MGEIKGIYAASVSILEKNLSLNITKTIKHAESLIDQGCHGVVIFGSTGQAQLISLSEKIELINKTIYCTAVILLQKIWFGKGFVAKL